MSPVVCLLLGSSVGDNCQWMRGREQRAKNGCTGEIATAKATAAAKIVQRHSRWTSDNWLQFGAPSPSFLALRHTQSLTHSQMIVVKDKLKRADRQTAANVSPIANRWNWRQAFGVCLLFSFCAAKRGKAINWSVVNGPVLFGPSDWLTVTTTTTTTGYHHHDCDMSPIWSVCPLTWRRWCTGGWINSASFRRRRRRQGNLNLPERTFFFSLVNSQWCRLFHHHHRHPYRWPVITPRHSHWSAVGTVHLFTDWLTEYHHHRHHFIVFCRSLLLSLSL